MRGFSRDSQLLSLCGLNCGLCTMRLGGYCPGCGGGEGNQSCKIARCSLEHGSVAYCCDCSRYPCEMYRHFDDFDSFITHRRRAADLERVRETGEEAYHAEQRQKIEILNFLLNNFNDGRRKTLFCTAVNLLELADLQKIVRKLTEHTDLEELPLKEKSALAVKLFQQVSQERSIDLKLRKKK